ncbi:MAG: arginyltransferase [Gammaproteobacteria bacterium]|nr:arginyltransferase [Gammaproteobacteria bacterium]MBU1654981.1 arginyltransferase [Gammaproteobacteria bacterium]MBU1962333.1 arginyltransferase [Gammaproteobacteria bacterium]
MSADQLRLFITPPHPCSYFGDRQALTLFADPAASFDMRVYQWLIDQGFRRSGKHIYKPNCDGCKDCIPVRVPVRDWRPNRSQRRSWNRSAARIEVRALAPRFDPNHYALYADYIASRHPDGDMADHSPETFLRFLTAEWCATRFVELRLDGRLLGVAVTDYLPRGLSAVYTFFDPEQEAISPGVLGILWQIQQARALGREWLYLGYWIPDCRKMAYKDQYRPFDALIDGKWRRMA